MIVGATGAAFTVRVAVLLVAPGPLSLEEIGAVVLFFTPVVVAFTFTEIKHAPVAVLNGNSADLDATLDANLDAPRRRPAIDGNHAGGGFSGTDGATMPPVRLMTEEPGTAVTVPPQSLLSRLDDATSTPGGKVSVN